MKRKVAEVHLLIKLAKEGMYSIRVFLWDSPSFVTYTCSEIKAIQVRLSNANETGGMQRKTLYSQTNRGAAKGTFQVDIYVRTQFSLSFFYFSSRIGIYLYCMLACGESAPGVSLSIASCLTVIATLRSTPKSAGNSNGVSHEHIHHRSSSNDTLASQGLQIKLYIVVIGD